MKHMNSKMLINDKNLNNIVLAGIVINTPILSGSAENNDIRLDFDICHEIAPSYKIDTALKSSFNLHIKLANELALAAEKKLKEGIECRILGRLLLEEEGFTIYGSYIEIQDK